MSHEKGGAPLPKFGEWDVNNPASAEGFTVIFNKARDDKKTGRDASTASPPITHNNGAKAPNGRTYTNNKQTAAGSPKPTSKKWLCCV